MILYKMQSEKEFYTKTNRKIAEYILENPKKITTSTMSEVASALNVSQGSVNNFAKKICGGGYAVLKIKIAEELSEYKEDKVDIVSENDDIKDVLNKVISEINSAFIRTSEIIDKRALTNTVNMLVKAKRIEIYGIYTSGIVAEEFYHKLLLLGLPAVYVKDPLMCPVSASMLDNNCLVVAVSSSGVTKDIYDAVKIAKENNVPAICITQNENGAISKLCDEVLIVAANTSVVDNKPDLVRMCDLLLIDAICAYIKHRIDEKKRRQFERLKTILDSHSIEE